METPSTPTQLGRDGIEVTRTDTGLIFRAQGLLNKGVLGGSERTVSWDEGVSLEQTKTGLKVRAHNFTIVATVPKDQLAFVPDFISAAVAQRHQYVLANPAVPPTVLVGSSSSMERAEEGFTIRARGRLDRAALGAETRTIPWMELLTIEATMGGVCVRWGGNSFAMVVPNAETHRIPAFIEATLEQHEVATGRSAGSGQELTRSERREIATTGFAQLLESRLPELREVIVAGDVTAEHRMLGELRILARQHGQKNVETVVDTAYRELLTDMGRTHPVPVGKWGNLRVWEDRVSMGDEAYRIDRARTRSRCLC